MKTLAALFLLVCLTAFGQTVKVPINLTAEIPLLGTNVYVTIVTNITYVTTNVYVTNLFVTNVTQVINMISPPTTITPMANDIIDTRLGTRMIRVMSAPANFSFDNWAPNLYATLYWQNPNRLPLRWPTNVIWLTPAPTNQDRGAVLFEQVGKEMWATP